MARATAVGRAEYMRQWRAGVGKENYEIRKQQRKAVAHAQRQLVQRHRTEYRELVVTQCRAAKVPVPSSVI